MTGERRRQWPLALTVAFCVAGLIPVTARLFEASMQTHLLVQMPLLAFCGGYWVYRSEQLQTWLERADPSGGVALVLSSGWMIYWMLPLNMDLATFDPGARVLKILTVPLLGATVTWSWRRLGPVGRGVMLMEGWAMLVRLGWVFQISPVQLCSNYLIDDQQRTGSLLLGVALIGAILAAVWGLFGPFRKTDRSRLE